MHPQFFPIQASKWPWSHDILTTLYIVYHWKKSFPFGKEWRYSLN